MEDIKVISGFEFIKAGSFAISDNPYEFKDWTSEIVMNLYDERYEKADETAYFITDGDEILYAGEFTYNLKDRWISKGHVNHHMYDNIDKLLKEGRSPVIWLAISPYCEIPEYGEINISKSIEQQILRDFQPKWNSRNKHSESKEWRDKNCIRLDSYVRQP